MSQKKCSAEACTQDSSTACLNIGLVRQTLTKGTSEKFLVTCLTALVLVISFYLQAQIPKPVIFVRSTHYMQLVELTAGVSRRQGASSSAAVLRICNAVMQYLVETSAIMLEAQLKRVALLGAG